MSTSLIKTEFEADLVKEYSITPTVVPMGHFKCSMELFTSDGSLRPGVGMIEWIMGVDTDEEDVAATIGVWWNAEKELTDYDGVFSLNSDAIDILQKAGITVPKGEGFWPDE